jgi:hypothetical protein
MPKNKIIPLFLKKSNNNSMKTKLIFSTKTKDTEQWTDIPVIPRLSEWINISDILREKEIVRIKQSAQCWSGVRGIVQSVEYRHDNNEFYVVIFIWCED